MLIIYLDMDLMTGTSTLMAYVQREVPLAERTLVRSNGMTPSRTNGETSSMMTWGAVAVRRLTYVTRNEAMLIKQRMAINSC